MTDRLPEESEVYQSEHLETVTVPVRIEGPVEVRSLPAVGSAVNRWLINDQIPPIKASGRNPYRKRILLIGETAGFFFGNSQAQADGRGNCGFCPVGVVLELTHTEEIWVNNPVAGSCTVTVVEEMWTS